MGWSLSEEGIQMLMLSGQDKVGALPPHVISAPATARAGQIWRQDPDSIPPPQSELSLQNSHFLLPISSISPSL